VACRRPGVKPVVDVGLLAAVQGDVAFAEPAEEAGCGADAVAGVRGRSSRPGVLPGAGPQAAHHLPGGIGLHQPPVNGRLDGGEQFRQPAVSAGECLVA